MISFRRGTVTTAHTLRPGLTEIKALIEGNEEKAYNYDDLTGPVKAGDKVFLNVTAVQKQLGTGGFHFVMANESNKSQDAPALGHIMKLRYSPFQLASLAVEEEESGYARLFEEEQSLEGMPVVAATLHSMLGPVAAGIKFIRPEAGIAFVMTDGAALPLVLSNTVQELKEKGFIDATITIGHAFGGDYEAINVYSGLLAAKVVAKADIAIVAMGPGIVGSGTAFGFTGTEQGEVVNAINVLGGRAVAVPRISFADKRERHRGISHHTLTALGKVAMSPSTIVLPRIDDHEKTSLLKARLEQGQLAAKHKIVEVDGAPALEKIAEARIKLSTMGRTVNEDREFFLAAGAAGIYAAGII